jgi:hypothetical protein
MTGVVCLTTSDSRPTTHDSSGRLFAFVSRGRGWLTRRLTVDCSGAMAGGLELKGVKGVKGVELLRSRED